MFNKSRKKQNIKKYCSGDTSKKYEQERKKQNINIHILPLRNKQCKAQKCSNCSISQYDRYIIICFTTVHTTYRLSKCYKSHIYKHYVENEYHQHYCVNILGWMPFCLPGTALFSNWYLERTSTE